MNRASAIYLGLLVILLAGVTVGYTQLNCSGGLFGCSINHTLYPSADGTTAVQITRANGTSVILNVDSTNSRIGLGPNGTSPQARLDVVDSNMTLSAGANVLIDTSDAQGIDIGGSLGFGGNADTLIRFGQISGRKENATPNNRNGYLSFATFTNGVGLVEALRLSSAQYATFASGMSVNNAVATGTMNVSGTVYASGLTAEPGTKSAMCHDDVTNQVETNPAATCTFSSLEAKDPLGPISCKEARRIVKEMKPYTFRDKGTTTDRFGFAAEWVAPVDPKLVYYSKGKPHAVDYERYTSVLTRYLQCQM